MYTEQSPQPNPSMLQITGVVFSLVIHVPAQPKKYKGNRTICHVYIEDEAFDIYVTPSGHLSGLQSGICGDAQGFLMLARLEPPFTPIEYELLLLEWREEIAYRFEAVTLYLPDRCLGLVASMKPTLKTFWLG